MAETEAVGVAAPFMAKSTASTSPETDPSKPIFTRREVSQHASKEDLWLIVDRRVVDMTSYLRDHPGGEAMLKFAGQDASSAIRAVDSHALPWNFIQRKLDELCIGFVRY